MPGLEHKQVLLGHSSGGKLMEEIIDKVFRPLLPKEEKCLNDAAWVKAGTQRLVLTTDSFVVDPIFFPGGDIGALAVHGTVNDLAVSGARPLALSVAFILEEGFPMADLQRIVASLHKAAERVGVPVITGDTKVVQRGKCDKVYINTTGVGIPLTTRNLSVDQARPGDRILLNGEIALHGMAILAAREELELDTPIQSDTAPLHELIAMILEGGNPVRCMRDPTRGGVASTLHEIARASKVGMRIDESQIPVPAEVRGACELLGLDPLQVANEGKVLVIVDKEAAPKVLEIMRSHPLGRDATDIGEVVDDPSELVIMRTQIGGYRVVDTLAGEQLPRIC